MKKIIFILLVISAFSCKKDFLSEAEPNNSFDKANPIEIGREIRGYLGDEEDFDIYQLAVSEKMIISIEVSAVKGVNHAIEIYRDNAGKKLFLKHIDDSRKSSAEKMPNISVDDGIYYIKIMFGDRDKAAPGKSVFYSLKLKSREYIFEEEEGNDVFKMATGLPVEEKYSGYFYPAFNKKNKDKDAKFREEDYYYIDVDASADSPVLLDVMLSAVKNIDSQIFLYNPQGRLIAEANTGTSSEEESLTDVGLTESGKYFVMVSSVNYESNYDDAYTIQAFIKSYDSGVEMEPNNSVDAKNVIVDGIVNGKIFPQGDEDFYSYSVKNPGSALKIEIIPPVDVNIKFDIFNGENIYTVDNFENGETEIFPNYIADESILLRVYSSASTFSKDMNYGITITESELEEGEEKEPNDSVDTAIRVNGNYLKGYLSKPDDKDYFLIEANKRVKLKFDVKGIDDCKFEFSIADSLGYILKTVEVEGDTAIEVEEMVDMKGYIIVESKGSVSNYPYYIEIGE